MNVQDFIHASTVTTDLKSTTKDDVLNELVIMLVKAGELKRTEKDQILTRIKEREILGSTGIGKGIGIPHAKTTAVKKLVSAVGISKSGIDFKSLDGANTFIFFLLIAPPDAPGMHLKALAKISRLLDDKFVRDRLRAAKTSSEIVKIIIDEDKKKLGEIK